MEVTKPYKSIGFGAMEVTKPYKFIGFGAMEVTKPYKFIGFGALHRVTEGFRDGASPLNGHCAHPMPHGGPPKREPRARTRGIP